MDTQPPASGRRESVRLVELHTRLNGVLAELLESAGRFDTPETRSDNGVTDLASWFEYDLGVARGTARTWARVAARLAELPAIARAFRAGALSFDEVAILCRYASADTESALLRLARDVPVEDLAAAVREHLAIAPRPRAHPPRPAMRMWWTDDSLELRGTIPGADGVLVETTLLRLAAQAPLDPDSGLFRDPGQRYAEALVQMSSEALAEDRDHDRATVVVHVGLDALSDPDATVSIGGRTFDRHEFLRVTCEGRMQPALDGPGGVTVGIGRLSRQIPPWLRRVMQARDGGCRFPGCRRTRWTHGHHLRHWADGGPTNLDNLVTLCGFHHRLVHRQGWRLTGNPNDELAFIDRWGKRYRPARPRFSSRDRRFIADLSCYRDYRLGLLAAANAPP